MKRALVLSLAALSFGPPQQAPSSWRQVQALADAGRLDEAERRARSGGAPLSAALGDVLVLRGRLAAAESAYRAASSLPGAGRWAGRVGLGELARRAGNLDAAFYRADTVAAAYERDGSRWASDDRAAAGRAYLLLGSEARWVRAALAAFDDAVAADSSNIDAMIRIGDLFIDKYNAPDATSSYETVLRRSPDHPRAILGMARVAEFTSEGDAMATARTAVEKNASLTAGHVLIARRHLEAEDYDSAGRSARMALAVDSSATKAWAILGAIGWLTGDSALFASSRAAATRLNPRPADYYEELAEAAGRHRRYADAVRFAREAATMDTTSVRALGVLGSNQLRTGAMADGRANLERAFALDPYNLWHKNTLDLLDKVAKFRTLERGRFRLVAPAADIELLSTYLLPLLERAYDEFAARYDYRPPTPIRLEVYGQHADFSVRTVGLAGIGALGVSFGTVLAMDGPLARPPRSFNYGSTAWHELAHTFTLGKSAHRVPRWLSEGLSVLEQRRFRPEWGFGPDLEFIAAYKAGNLRRLSELNEGFVRPRSAAEIGNSYYLASLVCEMIEARHGPRIFAAMLGAYANGMDTEGVFRSVLRTSLSDADREFDAWVRNKFQAPLNAVDAGERGSVRGAFAGAMQQGLRHIEARNVDSARAAFTRAHALFPQYAGEDGPAWHLYVLERARGNAAVALQHLTLVTGRVESAWQANSHEADLRAEARDDAGLMAALDRLLWIWPYDAPTHVRLADVATRAGNHALAVRERRAVIALQPTDRLDARYQLAVALAASGDTVSARREVLGVLEQAPGYQKAQTLLLALRSRAPEARKP